ncbi:MAG: hypothetical protein NUV77_16780 [Thermoguttaceae bacterium]|nr:hypothetical protein [Thermoguttaceae bacterium]
MEHVSISAFAVCLGLAMFVAAGVLVGLCRRSDRGQPWPWLAAFAAAQGTGLWLAPWAEAWRSGALVCAHLAATLASWVALVEFGRRGLWPRRSPRIGWWIHPVLLTATILAACLGGWDAVDRAGRFAVGLPGMLLAAPVLYRVAWSGRRQRSRERLGRLAAATVLSVLVVLAWTASPRLGRDVPSERTIVAGAIATARDGSAPNEGRGGALVVARGAPGWENITSRRLRWGIPLLLAVGACAAVALAACHQASRRP